MVQMPYSPAWQLVFRVALWCAVAIGCVGGVVALAGLSDRSAEPVAVDAAGEEAEAISVPAPVAGTAELVVEDWLTATEDDRERLDELFVEPAALRPVHDGDEVVASRVTAVTGHLVQTGYWVVTVRAEVTEQVDGEAQPAATWFVEVGIVGDVGEGLAALATPAVMPAPQTDPVGWESSRPALRRPATDDPVVDTVEGFLDALLAGQGDPSRYLAPGVEMPAAAPPPFTDVTVEEMAVEEQAGGDLHVWVGVRATTPGGRDQPVAYELIAVPREDRWEIEVLWGAPSLDDAPDAGS